MLRALTAYFSLGSIVHLPGHRDMEIPLTQEIHQLASTKGPAAIEEAGEALGLVVRHDGPLAQCVDRDPGSLLGKAVVPVSHQISLRPVELHWMLEPVKISGDRLPFAVLILVAERALPELLPHCFVAGNDCPEYRSSQLRLQPKPAADRLVQRLMQLRRA